MDEDSSIDYRIDSFFLVLYVDISLERLSYHFERELKILPDGCSKIIEFGKLILFVRDSSRKEKGEGLF